MPFEDRSTQIAVTLPDVRGESAAALLGRLRAFVAARGSTVRAEVALAIQRHLDSPPPAPGPVEVPPLPPCDAPPQPPAKRGVKPGTKRKKKIT